MISKKLEKAMNVQINKEMFSEYLYMAMSAWLESENLNGFANFFKVQAQEERFHAMKIWNFVNERGGRVLLEELKKPQNDFESALQIFEMALDHEKFISKSINELMDLAIEEKDHASTSFLNWFIDEQVEEEASMDDMIAKLKLLGGKGHGMFMIDKDLATRTFTPPTN